MSECQDNLDKARVAMTEYATKGNERAKNNAELFLGRAKMAGDGGDDFDKQVAEIRVIGSAEVVEAVEEAGATADEAVSEDSGSAEGDGGTLDSTDTETDDGDGSTEEEEVDDEPQLDDPDEDEVGGY